MFNLRVCINPPQHMYNANDSGERTVYAITWCICISKLGGPVPCFHLLKSPVMITWSISAVTFTEFLFFLHVN